MNDNELIAKFMNEPTSFIHDTGSQVVELRMSHDYHDWNKLMPVVEKIELTEILGYRFKVIITKEGCEIFSWIRGSGKKYIKFDNTGYPKIKAVFTSIVEFIKWHNQQKQ